MASTIYNPDTMSTSEVKKMQQALVDAGYSVGSSGVDGVWGKDTAAALSAYKAATGGSNSAGWTVGNETFNKLYGSSSSGSSSGSSGSSSNKYVITGNDTGYNADIANKAQAYLTGGTYTPGQAIDTNWWGAGGGKATMYGNDKTYKGQAMTKTDMEKAAYYAALYDSAQNNAARNEGYNNAMGEMEGIVQSALVPYQQMFSNMQTQQNNALQQAQRLSASQINNAYNMSARDYYQLYKTQQAKLPENLSKIGATGGASESAQLKLMNNYSENLYKNEAARANQLAGVNQNYNDQIAQNSINAANQMANAYLQMAQQQLAYKRQDELAAKEQQTQAEENASAQTVAQWNANVRARMEEQLAKGDTIWTWTDESGRIHWTTYESRGLAMGGKKLSPSSGNVKSTGGSGGGTGGGGEKPKIDDTPLENTPSSATSYSYDTLKYNMTNALLKGATKTQLLTFVDPIEAAYKSGKITEKQANELLKMLGA